MTTSPGGSAHTVLAGLDEFLPRLETVYTGLHAHPEPAMHEDRTSGEVAKRLIGWGFEVATGVGGTGVVGVLPNGDGPAVLLRAEMDGQPGTERPGLPNGGPCAAVGGGRAVPFTHARGHDMHMACLLGAARLLARALPSWSGTLLVVFQPAATTGAGAQAMIDDGLFARFPAPSVILAQRLVPLPAGLVRLRAGSVTAARDSLRVRFRGHAAPDARLDEAADPAVRAASAALRLRRAGRRAAVSVTAASVDVEVDVRTVSDTARIRVLAAVERVVRAEGGAPGRGPEVERTAAFPAIVNDPVGTAQVADALTCLLGPSSVRVITPRGEDAGDSDVRTDEFDTDDFGRLGPAARAPSCLWLLGGGAAGTRSGTGGLPSPVPPFFAPLVHPTLGTGVRALVAAALAWLASER